MKSKGLPEMQDAMRKRQPLLVQESSRPPVLRGAGLEKHYSVKEIADSWGLSVRTIGRLFYQEDGVLKLSRPAERHKRRYRTMRIPASIVWRVYQRMTCQAR